MKLVGCVRRQNSGEGARACDPVGEALAHFSQRFERISREVVSVAGGSGGAAGRASLTTRALQDGEEGPGRVGALAAVGACPCWCAHWAEVHVRSPTGDVAWAMRMQNNMSFDYLLESPLQDVAALLATPATAPAAPAPADARTDEPRSRSGSASSLGAGRSDLHKSRCVSEGPRPGRARAEAAPVHSSDSVVARPSQAPGPRAPTQPINIPGSPQRQSSSSTTDDDDMLLVVPSVRARFRVGTLRLRSVEMHLFCLQAVSRNEFGDSCARSASTNSKRQIQVAEANVILSEEKIVNIYNYY